MNSVGDSFAWAFRDPQWPGKMIVQGLIAIIPIVGWIAMTGWLMLAFETRATAATSFHRRASTSSAASRYSSCSWSTELR
jgi:hypothetical protein